MDRYQLKRITALVLALLLCVTVLAGCEEDEDKTYTCEYCGSFMTNSPESLAGQAFFHGDGHCRIAAPCGIEGHYVVRDYDENYSPCDKDGVAHIPCPVCGVLLCQHGEPCVPGDEFYQMIIVVFPDGSWVDLLANPEVTYTGSGECTFYIIQRNGCYAPDPLGHNGDTSYVTTHTLEPGNTYTFDTSLRYSTSGFSSESGKAPRDERFEVGEREFKITVKSPPPIMGSAEAPLSGDNTLSTFKVEFPNGTTVDMRNPDVRKNITVADVSSAVVTALPSHGKASVTGDKGNITLTEGENKFRVVVTAEDGSKAYFNYTINVTFTPPQPSAPSISHDASLASLSLSAPDHVINLSPVFSSGTYAYNTEVSGLDSLTISAAANHAGATVSGAGLKSLSAGDNVFDVTVTAEDGTTQQTYTVTVTASLLPSPDPTASSDASLASLSLSAPGHTINLSPEFLSHTYTYNAGVSGLESLTISAAANHANATVGGAGLKLLADGDNVFDVTVTAEDGTQQTYTVTVAAENVPPTQP